MPLASAVNASANNLQSKVPSWRWTSIIPRVYKEGGRVLNRVYTARIIRSEGSRPDIHTQWSRDEVCGLRNTGANRAHDKTEEKTIVSPAPHRVKGLACETKKTKRLC